MNRLSMSSKAIIGLSLGSFALGYTYRGYVESQGRIIPIPSISTTDSTPLHGRITYIDPDTRKEISKTTKKDWLHRKLEELSTDPISAFHKENSEVLIIAGGSAGSANSFAFDWLKRGPQREVVFIVRDEKDVFTTPYMEGRIRWIILPKEGFADKKLLQEYISIALEDKNVSKIAMVSLIGSAVLSGPQTFYDINVAPVINTAKAIMKYAKDRGVVDITVVNISSIAASLIDPTTCPYVMSRVEADGKLLAFIKKKRESQPEILLKGIAMRPGMIKTPSEDRGDFCPWDVEQFIYLPFIVIPGSGKQQVPIVDLDDLITATINCIDSKEPLCEIVDAVVEHRYTYDKIMDFYIKRAGGKRPPSLYIPAEVMQTFANTVPLGKIAPYAGLLFDVLDHEEVPVLSHARFQELLGRNPQSLKKTYPKSGIPYTFHAPPVKEHALKTLREITTNPEIGLRLAVCCLANAPSILGRTATQLAPAKKPGRSPYAIKKAS